jgi:hypothetical protein
LKACLPVGRLWNFGKFLEESGIPGRFRKLMEKSGRVWKIQEVSL